MRPVRAEIGRLPDRRPEPFVAARAVDRRGFRIGDYVIDRPVLAIRPPRLPGLAVRGTFQNEDAFFRTYEDECFAAYRRLLFPASQSRGRGGVNMCGRE